MVQFKKKKERKPITELQGEPSKEILSKNMVIAPF